MKPTKTERKFFLKGRQIGELAKAVGMSRVTISRHLNGQRSPTLHQRSCYARALAWDLSEVDDFFSRYGYSRHDETDPDELVRDGITKPLTPPTGRMYAIGLLTFGQVAKIESAKSKPELAKVLKLIVREVEHDSKRQ